MFGLVNSKDSCSMSDLTTWLGLGVGVGAGEGLGKGLGLGPMSDLTSCSRLKVSPLPLGVT